MLTQTSSLGFTNHPLGVSRSLPVAMVRSNSLSNRSSTFDNSNRKTSFPMQVPAPTPNCTSSVKRNGRLRLLISRVTEGIHSVWLRSRQREHPSYGEHYSCDIVIMSPSYLTVVGPLKSASLTSFLRGVNVLDLSLREPHRKCCNLYSPLKANQ